MKESLPRFAVRTSKPGAAPLFLAITLAFSGLCLNAAEPLANPKPESPAPKLTERDYLLEEINIAGEQLKYEERQVKEGKSTPDTVLGAKRSLLSLQRQLAAYDERTHHPTPEQVAVRKRLAEEEKQRNRRAQVLKEEMLGILLDIAQKDADAKVRARSISSITRLQLPASIEPLSRILLKDPDSDVRAVALEAILSFASEESSAVLLNIFDELSELKLKTRLLSNLRQSQLFTNEYGGTRVEMIIPPAAFPKLISLARESPSKELRRMALSKLSQIPGEATTKELVAIYDSSDTGLDSTGDIEFKQSIVQYLGRRPDQTAAHKLVAIAKADPDPRARQLAVDLIGGLPFGR